MRSAQFVFLLLLLVLFHADAADAEDFTGNKLNEYCLGRYDTKAEAYSTGICAGYIAGVTDMLSISPKSKLCLPGGVTNGQVRSIVVKYLREHPEQLHEPAAILVSRALIRAFPCHE